MRRILNKQFTNAEILDKATWIFENGIQNLKLYYMVGLPFEEHDDVEAIVDLTEQIRERMLAVARGRGRIGRIHPSVNPFVPKPGTPYQWLPMEDPKETDRKLQYLRKAFARMPNVDAICKSARTGAVAVDPRPGRPARGRRPRDRGRAGAWTSSARCETPGSIRPSTSSAAAAEDEILPWDIDRQRRQQGLLPAGARRRARRSSSRPTAPRSRAASAAASASRRRTRPTRCPRSGRAARRCRSTRAGRTRRLKHGED